APRTLIAASTTALKEILHACRKHTVFQLSQANNHSLARHIRVDRNQRTTLTTLTTAPVTV
ncbi:MAG: hypothetical protein ACYC4N_25770, partial [Pirellulaceae bacterium]